MPQDSEKVSETLPVVEETVAVEKRKKVTGLVRVRTSTRAEDVTVDEPLVSEEITVERVPADRWADDSPTVRQEGDTTIVLVLEEVPVVEKRLKVVEEIRLTRRRTSRPNPQAVTLRRQEATVERLDPPPGGEAEAAHHHATSEPTTP